MNTPTAALGWQLWRKHRWRLAAIAGILLAFIVVYPKLCAMMGFHLERKNVNNELAGLLASNLGGPTLSHIVHLLYLIFLAWSPALAMLATLLYTLWMFTFTDFDPKAKDPLSFPMRVFTLPISTSFLFWRLLLGGLVAVFALYTIWVRCVWIPNLEDFGSSGNFFVWMTLLAMVQAIVWALAGWPTTRMLVVLGTFFLFLASPARRDLESPICLIPLFLLGVAAARIGLQKLRHGQWQPWLWKWPFANWGARADPRGPKQFASPAQAQLWFEWRQSAERMCFFTVILALVPVAIQLVCNVIGFDNETMDGFTLYLAFMPLVIYFIFGVESSRKDLPFLLVRPLTSGAVVVSKLKVAAISTVLSWVAVFAALGIMSLLGDFHAVMQHIPVIGVRIVLVIGMVFATWRITVIHLCFALTGDKRIAQAPILFFYGQLIGAGVLLALAHDGVHLSWFWNNLILVLACLLAVKLLLAFQGFRISLKRRLLAPSALVGYLIVWGLLVAAFQVAIMYFVGPHPEQLLPVFLYVVLSVPLARISFSPIALEWGRHR